MFKWVKKLFSKRKLPDYSKHELISVQLDDGTEVPLVANDNLELVKNDQGDWEIRIKNEQG